MCCGTGILPVLNRLFGRCLVCVVEQASCLFLRILEDVEYSLMQQPHKGRLCHSMILLSQSRQLETTVTAELWAIF